MFVIVPGAGNSLPVAIFPGRVFAPFSFIIWPQYATSRYNPHFDIWIISLHTIASLFYRIWHDFRQDLPRVHYNVIYVDKQLCYLQTG